ncbi:unnamed protein product [Prorocentrum cordatum]|uniref:UBA domain-containing protein n=1 Tax=Prorocentrum cordatum TaxID=2364126 RepID=A0ABN9UR37_9DINO|nr:unnamed protein product [Polarella glacialis]
MEGVAARLAEATGRPLAEALGALRARGGSAEEAADLLLSGAPLEGQTGGGPGGGAAAAPCGATGPVAPGGAEPAAEGGAAARLAEATGRPREDCAAALAASGGDADAAAAALLGADDGAPGDAAHLGDDPGSAAERDSDVGIDTSALGAEDEAVAAERLAEATGRPHGDCVRALRRSGGRADVAATYLLPDAEAEADAGGVAEAEEDGAARGESPPQARPGGIAARGVPGVAWAAPGESPGPCRGAAAAVPRVRRRRRVVQNLAYEVIAVAAAVRDTEASAALRRCPSPWQERVVQARRSSASA